MNQTKALLAPFACSFVEVLGKAYGSIFLVGESLGEILSPNFFFILAIDLHYVARTSIVQ